MPKSINLTGTAGKTYDLDEVVNGGKRTDESALVVQIWKWNPNLPKENVHKNPNPPKPEVGQIWLSQLTPLEDFND